MKRTWKSATKFKVPNEQTKLRQFAQNLSDSLSWNNEFLLKHGDQNSDLP